MQGINFWIYYWKQKLGIISTSAQELKSRAVCQPLGTGTTLINDIHSNPSTVCKPMNIFVYIRRPKCQNCRHVIYDPPLSHWGRHMSTYLNETKYFTSTRGRGRTGSIYIYICTQEKNTPEVNSRYTDMVITHIYLHQEKVTYVTKSTNGITNRHWDWCKNSATPRWIYLAFPER